MLRQVRLGQERLLTSLALELLLSRVTLHVYVPVLLRGEALHAHGALELLLAHDFLADIVLGSFVLGQVVGTREGTFADVALKFLCSGNDIVILQMFLDK